MLKCANISEGGTSNNNNTAILCRRRQRGFRTPRQTTHSYKLYIPIHDSS